MSPRGLGKGNKSIKENAQNFQCKGCKQQISPEIMLKHLLAAKDSKCKNFYTEKDIGNIRILVPKLQRNIQK